MSYTPPRNLWEVSEQLCYNEPLAGENDPRYVDTSRARTLAYTGLLRNLGVDEQAQVLRAQHRSRYQLFCGHRGSGKSTELRMLRDRLNRPTLFRVIFLDVLADLDVNSLQYPDVCFALARRLFAELKDCPGLELDRIFLDPLQRWFDERVLVREEIRDLTSKLETGAGAKGGIPLFAELFAKVTASFQVGSKVKDEVRTVFKSAYSEFAGAFNSLLAHVESKLAKLGGASRLLFMIDGTDRLDQSDSTSFFLEDVHQLRLLEGLFIYCAPIHLIFASNQAAQGYDYICKIPSLKLCEKLDPRPGRNPPVKEPAAYEVLRALILRRAPGVLFEPNPETTGDWSTVDMFITCSGGHLRDLLRLLDYAFQQTTGEVFTAESAQRAVKALSTDYRRILQPEDYTRLAEIDIRGSDYLPNDERSRTLLFNLALLEYNDFWWQSHPVVRQLPAYQEALGKLP